MVRSDLCVFIFATRNLEPAIIRRPLTPRFVIAEYEFRMRPRLSGQTMKALEAMKVMKHVIASLKLKHADRLHSSHAASSHDTLISLPYTLDLRRSSTALFMSNILLIPDIHLDCVEDHTLARYKAFTIAI